MLKGPNGVTKSVRTVEVVTMKPQYPVRFMVSIVAAPWIAEVHRAEIQIVFVIIGSVCSNQKLGSNLHFTIILQSPQNGIKQGFL